MSAVEEYSEVQNEPRVRLYLRRVYGGRVEVSAEDKAGEFYRDQLKVYSQSQRDAFAFVCEQRRPGCRAEVEEQLNSKLKKWELCWDPIVDCIGGVVWARGDRIQPEPIQWLWEDRIPLGAVTVLDGDPGSGKSLVLADLAARTTRGFLAPDRRADVSSPVDSTPGEVWWISGNEDPSSMIVPRILAAGGDLSKVRFIEGADDETCYRRLSFPEDIDKLRNDRIAIPKLIIVDPLAAFCGSRGVLHESTGRKALAAFSDFARQFGCAIVVVRHLNRRVGLGAFERGSAGPSLLAECRSALLLASHPDDPNKRVLAGVKNNLGPLPRSLELKISNDNNMSHELSSPRSLPSKISNHPDPPNALSSSRFGEGKGPSQTSRQHPSHFPPPHNSPEAARVTWLEYSDVHADDLVRKKKPASEFAEKEQARAETWLKQSLEHGPKLATEIKEQANHDDIPAAILRRARVALGIETTGSNGHAEWRLPHIADPKNARGDTPSCHPTDQSPIPKPAVPTGTTSTSPTKAIPPNRPQRVTTIPDAIDMIEYLREKGVLGKRRRKPRGES